ncbi:tRNA-splicing endonuclease subunit sen54 [Pleurotus ostreatus]|uniref:tRNA-splicing endonuclease subunit sen54 n=1 Tax=Pleurotus ostreatus TaxID=5322 RepID=A0A8H7DQC8_PLEOS|nr:tRNA-splicing endonuclease subunit sen54 [Pleurotus ostreatus]KAF7422970.1 tRNA-splicing endonuclease subunit sen54 [Pleurotus ostreatus]KAJ8691039.1 tRNA-splicing endonuclease subunit sen54 [Pleurotus ostreatus]
MDDALELPNAPPKPVQGDEPDENSSGDEDSGADWTKLSSLNINRPIIPRRGEKEFEPAPGGGSGLQIHVLDRARSAMFDALRATRSTSSKAMSYAVWYPSIARAHVTLSRGIHFTSMGHSVPRKEENEEKTTKRLELLPEEAIYMIERGALFCTKAGGAPMSAQQAFSEMLGTEDMTLEKYQVYSYLKRLGYVVTRATPPSPFYPVTPPSSTSSTPLRHQSLFSRFTFHLTKLFSRFNWWRPLCINPWLRQHMSYEFIYKSLRFIPSGHNAPLHVKHTSASPYKIFYHLYKPSTPFKKTSPPPPDFSVVVVDARVTQMPTLRELDDLFGELPELPPPLSRQRHPQQGPQPARNQLPPAPPTPTTLWSWISSWVFKEPETPSPLPRRPNPFAALKAGKRIVVIAAVDAGNISFFRFGQGGFEDWPMM